MKPNFPIGEWYRTVDLFPVVKARNENCLFGYDGGGAHPASVDQWCAAATAAGLYYFLQFAPNTVGRAQDPNLLGWMLQPDEPNGAGNHSPGQMFDQLCAARNLSPSIPCAMNLDGGQILTQPRNSLPYLRVPVDIVMFDFYPDNYGQQAGGREQLLTIPKWIRANAGRDVKVIPFVETSNQLIGLQSWAATIKQNMSGPTVADANQEILGLVKDGVDGLGYFPDVIGAGFVSYDGTPQEVAAAITEINLLIGPKP